jgi:hypothetical protein
MIDIGRCRHTAEAIYLQDAEQQEKYKSKNSLW